MATNRITGLAAEVLNSGAAGKVRVTGLAAEVMNSGAAGKVRVTGLAAEVLSTVGVASSNTGTLAAVEAKDGFAALGHTPPGGVLAATENQDKWSTSSGFERLGIENEIATGFPLHFSTNGPDRLVVMMITGVAVVDPAKAGIKISSTGPVGSTMNFQLQDVLTAGPDGGSANYRMELWWAYAHGQIFDETFNIDYAAGGGVTTGTVHVFAVKGLNGNYDNPWDVSGNPYAYGSGVGALFAPPNTPIKAFTPVATGPLGSSGGTRSAISFDASTAQAATIDGTHLVVTSTGSGSDSFVTAPAEATKQRGVAYYEVRFVNIAGPTYGTGVLFSGIDNGPHKLLTNGTGGIVCRGDGTIWAAGVQVGSLGVTPANNDYIAVAIDFDHNKAWFKDITQSGNWNANPLADPQYNFGGLAFGQAGGYLRPNPISYGAGTGGGGLVAPPNMSTDGGVGFWLPYAFPGSTSSSAQQSYNFGGAAYVGAPPSGWTGWNVSVSSGSTTRVNYPSIVVGFNMAIDGGSTGLPNPTGTPTGYQTIEHETISGSQRTIYSTSYAQIRTTQILLSDNDFQVGPSAPRWAMMFDTLVGGALDPGSWDSTEAPDVMVARGRAGAFGVVGDLTATEAKDIFSAHGFQIIVGSMLAHEAPDFFSAFGFQPLTGTFVVTEASDRFNAAGVGRGVDGVFITTEAPDVFAAAGIVPISGSFDTTEAADRFLAIGAGVTRVRRRRVFFVT